MRSGIASFLVVWAAVSGSGCGGSAPQKSSVMPAARSSVVAAEAAGGGEAVMVASTDSDEGEAAPAAAGSTGGGPIAAGPVATDARTASPVLKEQVVVEAWLSVQVEDASETARA